MESENANFIFGIWSVKKDGYYNIWNGDSPGKQDLSTKFPQKRKWKKKKG